MVHGWSVTQHSYSLDPSAVVYAGSPTDNTMDMQPAASGMHPGITINHCSCWMAGGGSGCYSTLLLVQEENWHAIAHSKLITWWLLRGWYPYQTNLLLIINNKVSKFKWNAFHKVQYNYESYE